MYMYVCVYLHQNFSYDTQLLSPLEPAKNRKRVEETDHT